MAWTTATKLWTVAVPPQLHSTPPQAAGAAAAEAGAAAAAPPPVPIAPVCQSRGEDGGFHADPAFSPCGRYLAWSAMRRAGFESDLQRVCVLDLAAGAAAGSDPATGGGGGARVLTPLLDEAFGLSFHGLRWCGSQHILATGQYAARSRIFCLRATAASEGGGLDFEEDVRILPTDLPTAGGGAKAGGARNCGSPALCAAGLLFCRGHLGAPDDVYLLSWDAGLGQGGTAAGPPPPFAPFVAQLPPPLAEPITEPEPGCGAAAGVVRCRPLTSVNRARLAELSMAAPEEFYFPGSNQEPVHAWFVPPAPPALGEPGAAAGSSGSCPLVLVIHGGPQVEETARSLARQSASARSFALARSHNRSLGLALSRALLLLLLSPTGLSARCLAHSLPPSSCSCSRTRSRRCSAATNHGDDDGAARAARAGNAARAARFVRFGREQGAITDSFHFRWNLQSYSARGYGVLAVNFHGSTGFGQAFTDSISGDWGGAPYRDLVAGVRFTLEKWVQ
jgi:hypothetical protein